MCCTWEYVSSRVGDRAVQVRWRISVRGRIRRHRQRLARGSIVTPDSKCLKSDQRLSRC